MNKKFEYIDDNPGSYFGMLVEGFEDKEESLKEDLKYLPKTSTQIARNVIDLAVQKFGGKMVRVKSKTSNSTSYAYKADNESQLSQAKKFIDSKIKLSDKDESLKEDKFVSRDKMSKKVKKELNDKKRRTWGNTKPVTRVKPNNKAYDRKRDKKIEDESLSLQESKNKIYKIWFSDLDQVDDDYNKLNETKFKALLKKLMGPNCKLVSYIYKNTNGYAEAIFKSNSLKDLYNGALRVLGDSDDVVWKLAEDNNMSEEEIYSLLDTNESLEESKLNESSDGWDEGKLSDLSYILDKLANLQYEINNCVKGVYSHCTSYSELGEYIKDLGSELMDIADDVSEYVEEDDEEDED